MLPEIPLEAFLTLIAVLRIHRVKPDRFIQHIVGAVNQQACVISRLCHHAAVKEVFHQPAVGVDHAGIGLGDIQRVFPADGTFPPLPQVQRNLAVFHVLRHLQRKAVVAAVLVAFHVRMPYDIVIQKELPAVDLSVNKGAVFFVGEEDGAARPPVDDLLHEITDQCVKALVDKGKDCIQGKVCKEHIVGVAEHHIVRRRQIEQSATGSGQPEMVELDVSDGIRKAAEELL